MKFYGICPASCGEFVQGFVDNDEYLCSYAIDLYSVVTLEEKKNDVSLGPRKSREAVKKVFEFFGLPIKESNNISISIDSDIPIGKGMASSSADIGATILATLKIIGKSLSFEDISRLACEIEPTDSLYIKENCIFNPLNGEVIKYLGKVKNLKVIILEPDVILSTEKLRSFKSYIDSKLKNKDVVKEAFCVLEEGIRKNDLYAVGKASVLSGLANENIHKKQGLEKIIEISNRYGAYGVNVAHSGTVVGILVDDSMNCDRIIDLLRQFNLDKFYKKIYVRNIIDTGLRTSLDDIKRY